MRFCPLIHQDESKPNAVNNGVSWRSEELRQELINGMTTNNFSGFLFISSRSREAPIQRTEEEEEQQAEAPVSGPEPAQWPLGLCALQPVRRETAGYPRNPEPTQSC